MTEKKEHIDIFDSPIEEEMKSAYIDYAMSVIVGRALPDVRDGLKPVHRRVLFAMLERHWLHDRAFVKSAKIVGEVIGNYHPHGDVAVYDTIVRMVQDFSLREPLIYGQGNFGSVDGDSAAAYRYTEAKLSSIAEELLKDINKETVDYTPNFDSTKNEPVVLPAAFPNLLVNGSNGIAVGMATNIPPHNLEETINAAVYLVDHPECRVADLMRFVKGPDFPTSGIIHGIAGIKEAYETGKGKITLRGRVDTEETKAGKEMIVITEIPYQVNKSALIESIAALVRDKKIDGISALRDESDRKGMRIVLEVRKNSETQLIVNQLYKHTQLQVSVGVIMLALVKGLPRVLDLKEVLKEYVAHRREVVTRRTRFDLRKAEERAHILEGLIVALSNIDEVIKIIKESKTVESARQGLMNRFDFTQIQADAILDMKLQRLTGLEIDRIKQEFEEIKALIKKLKEILGSETRLAEVVKEELEEVKARYKSPRKTEIAHAAVQDFTVEDIIADEEMVITISHQGYIKRLPVDTYRRQKRGGKGVISTKVKEEDYVERILIATTHQHILFFTNRGKVFSLKGYEIPQESKVSKGRPIRSLLNLSNGETVNAFIGVTDFHEDLSLAMITAKGVIKKTLIEEFENAKKKGVTAIALQTDDGLIDVVPVLKNTEAFIASRYGQGLRTHLGKVRNMGRGARGIKGLTLETEDRVIGMTVVEGKKNLFVLTEKGYGKRVEFKNFTAKNRGGKGNKFLKVTDKVGRAVAVKTVADSDEIMIVTEKGVMIRVEASAISVLGRDTQGVRVISVEDDDKVQDVGLVAGDEE
jgi:DNA gyrase subunit A